LSVNTVATADAMGNLLSMVMLSDHAFQSMPGMLGATDRNPPWYVSTKCLADQGRGGARESNARANEGSTTTGAGDSEGLLVAALAMAMTGRSTTTSSNRWS
ncbi:MAG: hypothetical protein OEV34_01340, partial [Gammaproteobacteria bacterium]|nr:hypothetical protein [Gammaproteobacteria bacterium]